MTEVSRPANIEEGMMEDAEAHFFNIIAKNYPEIKTADFCPVEVQLFADAQKRMVLNWIIGNHPYFSCEDEKEADRREAEYRKANS